MGGFNIVAMYFFNIKTWYICISLLITIYDTIRWIEKDKLQTHGQEKPVKQEELNDSLKYRCL
jgi:hypothetical protein